MKEGQPKRQFPRQTPLSAVSRLAGCSGGSSPRETTINGFNGICGHYKVEQKHVFSGSQLLKKALGSFSPTPGGFRSRGRQARAAPARRAKQEGPVQPSWQRHTPSRQVPEPPRRKVATGVRASSASSASKVARLWFSAFGSLVAMEEVTKHST